MNYLLLQWVHSSPETEFFSNTDWGLERSEVVLLSGLLNENTIT